MPWIVLAAAVYVGCKPASWFNAPSRANREQIQDWREEQPYESLASRLAYEEERRPSPPEPAERTDSTTTIAHWKKEQAYKSLASRLEYEGGPLRSFAPAGFLEEAPITASGDASDRRERALRTLHESSAAEFEKQEGFGMERMGLGPKVLANRVSIDPVVGIGFDKVPSVADSEGPVVPAAYLDDQGSMRAGSDLWRRVLPVRSEIKQFHGDAAEKFASLESFGYVKSLKKVAGFRPHGFAKPPVPPINKRLDDEELRPEFRHWQVTRLELVSLLKHETPRVYVSNQLPRMDQLAAAPARALNSFEQTGLERLLGGEYVHYVATANRVEMVGALRAGGVCTKCHSVPEGRLLGAFSYELRRFPPLVVHEVTPASATSDAP